MKRIFVIDWILILVFVVSAVSGFGITNQTLQETLQTGGSLLRGGCVLGLDNELRVAGGDIAGTGHLEGAGGGVGQKNEIILLEIVLGLLGKGILIDAGLVHTDDPEGNTVKEHGLANGIGIVKEQP